MGQEQNLESFNFDKQKLKNYIEKLNQPRVLIIGDMGIDEMIYGETERISREAPVLILRHSNTKIILGQAANAANNLASINGGKVSAIGLYGNDHYGPTLLEAFNKVGINTEFMVKDDNRPTTVKSRISGSSFHSVTQQVVRIDRLKQEAPCQEVEDELIKNIEKAVPLHDAVILSDYNCGLLTDRVIQATVAICKKYGKLQTTWPSDIKKGFDECMRVLKPGGTLIFKWATRDITLKQILDVIKTRPIIYHKNNNTFFLVFMKGLNND